MRMAMSWLVVSAMVLAAAWVNAAEPAKPQWPLWDGKESVADYARRAGIKDVEMTLDLGSNVVMKLTLMPAGRFVMGDLDQKRETIGGKEVVIQAGGKGPACARPDREVTLSQREYACRAGTTGAYAGILDDMGWHLGNSDDMTHPVGRKKPNAWGLHDMHGNVREWCQNAPHKYPSEDVTDPVGPDLQENRLIRGGSWADYGFFCRSAARDEYKANLFGIGRNGPNIWQNPQTPRDGYPTLGLHPDFGCRLVITANAAP